MFFPIDAVEKHLRGHDVSRAGRWLLAAGAVIFLAAHLVDLPRTLEDLDSINFALGVREFDVARHQPHPPGYPLYIALAKVSTAAVRAMGVAAPEVRGLAFWGALMGALSVWPLFVFFRGLEEDARRAVAATLVTIAAPLYWFTASRPLSDMTGTATAIAAQALTIAAWRAQRNRSASDAAVRRLVLMAGVVAGVAIGFRSQTFVLTLPLLGVVVANPRVTPARRALGLGVAAVIAGVLAWGAPLIYTSGGHRAYLSALSDQGGEDFTGVAMLWTHHGKKEIAYALRDTFKRPWATVPLASVALTLAVLGVTSLAIRARAALGLLLAAALPYAVFHLLFHETLTVRYALPLLPAVAYLAVAGTDLLGSAAGRFGGPAAVVRAALSGAVVAGVIAASAWTAVPALRQYSAEGAPVFQALDAMSAQVTATGGRPAIAAHWESQRALEWLGGDAPGTPLPVDRAREWMAAVTYLVGGGSGPIWFLARPGRTDLTLIDPRSRTLSGHYEWTFDTTAYAGGARPNRVDWDSVESPAWMLAEGWALTAEIAGATDKAGGGPHLRPSVGYVRRFPGDVVLDIGGRHLGQPQDPPVRIAVSIDGRAVDEWSQPHGFFLHSITLPAGALVGDGPFARLQVTARAPGAPIPVKLEQFDCQPADAVVWGYGDGWMEPEYDPVNEYAWRWTLARATLDIHHANHDVLIRLHGQAKVAQFGGLLPTVTVRAGDRVVGTFQSALDFVQQFEVPASALAASGGHVTIDSDRTFSPSNGDPRQLALRIFDVTISASARR